jgi:hypothetical protein
MLVDKRLNMYISDSGVRRPHSSKPQGSKGLAALGGTTMAGTFGHKQLPNIGNNTFYGSSLMKDKAMLNTFVVKSKRFGYTYGYKSPFMTQQKQYNHKGKVSTDGNVLSKYNCNDVVYKNDVYGNSRTKDNEELKFRKENIKNLLKNNLLEFNDYRVQYCVEDVFKNEKVGIKLLG